MLHNAIHTYSGITSGRVLDRELLYTKILEVHVTCIFTVVQPQLWLWPVNAFYSILPTTKTFVKAFFVVVVAVFCNMYSCLVNFYNLLTEYETLLRFEDCIFWCKIRFSCIGHICAHLLSCQRDLFSFISVSRHSKKRMWFGSHHNLEIWHWVGQTSWSTCTLFLDSRYLLCDEHWRM